MNISRLFSAALAASLLILSLGGCAGGTDDRTITVGATPSPHAEILRAVQPLLEEQGYTLVIREFTDYVQPNNALRDKGLDANFFQHQPYLDDFNVKNKASLVSAAAIHFEPLGIYSETLNSLADLPEGAKVSVPNDASNEARALQLLQKEGLITLREGAGLSATVADIESNPQRLKIVEMAAEQIPLAIKDVTLAVANGNYAIKADILDRLLAAEDRDSDGARTYANILAVRSGDQDKAKIQALAAALTSDDARRFIEDTYNGAVIPVF